MAQLPLAMNFAIINGQKVPVGDDFESDDFEPDDFEHDNSEVTSLSPVEDTAFQKWIKDNKITDLDHPDSHYDYRGFWKENPNFKHEEGQHFTDKFKQHGHPSFSVESQYSKGPDDGGKWDGDKLVDSTGKVIYEDKKEEKKHPAISLLERAMTPLVDLMPGTREHMAEFERVHPILGALGRNAVDFTLGESSPMGLGLGLIGAGESAASSMGMDNVAKALKIPSRIAGGGMALHGYNNINNADTLSGKLGGFAEMGLGALAVRGPRGELSGRSIVKPELERRGDVFNTADVPGRNSLELPNPRVGTPPYNTSQFGLTPDNSLLQYPLNIAPNRLRPPSTNAAVFDALLPDSLKLNEQGAAIPPTTSVGTNRQPRELVKPIDLTPDEVQFHYNLWDRLKHLVHSETGAVGKIYHLRARDELLDALDTNSVTREVQEAGYKKEKSERFNEVDKVRTQGFKGTLERVGKLKGEYKKEGFTPVKINPDSLRALYNEIRRSPLSTPEQVRAEVALGKLVGDWKGGSLPQRNEIELLRRVFGDGVADKLTMMHSGVPVTVEALNEVANFSKSIMSSMDASAPFRQGLPLLHTREFWKNYGKMFSYANREVYDAMIQSIHEDPMFSKISSAGVKFTEIGAELGAREEQFASRMAEKIPGIPASERMYTGFLNKLRFDTTKKLMESAEASGLKVFELGSDGTTPVPTKLGKEIASYVNNATGRGSLGRLEKNAVELNSLFFSPRLISSRLTLLNPMYYIKASPFVRKEALKSLFAMATAGKMFEEIGKAAGGTVETDRNSADYHKVKIGNVRLDPYGGFQQYIVAASRLLTGKTTSTKTGKESELGKGMAPSRTQLILGLGGRQRSFMENKFSPLVGFIDDIASARTPESGGMGNVTNALSGRPIDAKVANLFTPMIAQDILDLAKEDPSLIPLAVLGAQGIGMQTYDSSDDSNGLGSLRELSR